VDELAGADLQRLHDSVYRFVRRRITSHEDAEDLTQEVLTQAIASFRRASVLEAPPLSWLYMVAERRVIDAPRPPRVVTVPLDDSPATGKPVGYDSQVVDALMAALESLSEQQRHVVILKLFEGRRFAEIAEIVGASEEACKMRLSRALLHLRTELSRRGVRP
jgi:RNA polymerase sigma-70 factor (ECF subfamily)